MERFDIYRVSFPFQDSDGAKKRPALLLTVGNDMSSFMKITSKGKSPLTHYKINNWQEAGLSRESYIEYDCIINVNKAEICEKVGRLSLADQYRIEKKLIYGIKKTLTKLRA